MSAVRENLARAVARPTPGRGPLHLQQGFTLFELVIVAVLVVVFAAALAACGTIAFFPMSSFALGCSGWMNIATHAESSSGRVVAITTSPPSTRHSTRSERRPA